MKLSKKQQAKADKILHPKDCDCVWCDSFTSEEFESMLKSNKLTKEQQNRLEFRHSLQVMKEYAAIIACVVVSNIIMDTMLSAQQRKE